ncbi:MAG TPA: Rrf2 family transcriptional regulator [Verrucomicrobiae bacterium]|jgi:Rrf2 family transcriptional regulator, iron-sulfur cluster assembly transcription factor|nr:Rrf2 family transcriptional regulator [Verrucomicrobiae bacterium]
MKGSPRTLSRPNALSLFEKKPSSFSHLLENKLFRDDDIERDCLHFSLASMLLRNGLSWSFDSWKNMRIGRESAYAIEGLLALAGEPTGAVMLLRDIAAARELPQSFLAKIFQKLARHGIVASSRGAVRGYALARPSMDIKVREILIAVEGADFLERCILWSDGCAKGKICALHSRWKRAERIVGDLMDRTTLADLAREEISETGSEHAFL